MEQAMRELEEALEALKRGVEPARKCDYCFRDYPLNGSYACERMHDLFFKSNNAKEFEISVRMKEFACRYDVAFRERT